MNGQAIVEVIPEVELIIGKQPTIISLPPVEAQNRLNLVFQQFIRVFTKFKHPLVIFLDDLQWADPASLQLIQVLIAAPDSRFMFLIGAYRDNEVSAAHPLMLMIDEVQKAKVVVSCISLSPFVISDDFTILNSIPVDSIDSDSQIPVLPTPIINYVFRTQKDIVLDDAVSEAKFNRHPYIIATQPKSVLCTPLLYQGKLSGILYLENNLITGAFTSDRVEVLNILSAQAAISIENSRLYEQIEDYNRTLEQKVETRTLELQQKNEELTSTLEKLKITQDQIIVQEKLASLGALAAGIAHEIKNPLNFVNNFAELSVELSQELLEEIEAQKERLDPESREYIEEIIKDISQNTQKINEHGKRADNIVHGMLMLSRGQAGKRELADINALLEESIDLADHGIRAKDSSFKIAIETNYDPQPSKLNVVPQNTTRAFINIINNAFYAVIEKKKELGEGFLPMLSVLTKDWKEQVEIRVRDNGKGIP